MKRLERLGGALSVFQGLGLISLTVFFGVLFPRAGVATPEDFANPAKYLPVVVLHPLWFSVPAFVHGLAADTLFVVTLFALWRRLSRKAPDLTGIAIAFGALAVAIYLGGHVLNTTYIAALIAGFAQGGEAAAAATAQFPVASSLYGAAMFGGSLFMGLSLALLGVACLRTSTFGRALGLGAVVVGLVDVASFFRFVPLALPLSGLLFVWLGIAMWRARAPEAEHE
jgi:hypothetical protein